MKRFKTSLVVLALGTTLSAMAQSGDIDTRIDSLEQSLQSIQSELTSLRQERDAQARRADKAEAELQDVKATQDALLEEVANIGESADGGEGSALKLPEGLRIGAYGEHHFNFTEEAGGNQSDIHRFVLFLGYEFADWIHFTSETEFEHAFVGDGEGGDLILEQFNFDFNINPAFNVRVGRMLHPAGIINRFHEPTSFNGVERPTFSSAVLPSTWFIDGIGFWGAPNDWFSYETYVHGGLDGRGLSTGSGIRGARLKERPGLEDIGWSSRVDVKPLIAADVDSDIQWNVGSSYSWVGLDNSNRGNALTVDSDGEVNNANDFGDVHVLAFDSNVTFGDFDFIAEWAQLYFTKADRFTTDDGVANDPAEIITGWYVEGAYHVMPDAWKTGKLEKADIVPFVRFSAIDTQDDVASGGTRDGLKNRDEITAGLSFYPIPNLVIKADYTFTYSDANNLPNRTELGIGYDF